MRYFWFALVAYTIATFYLDESTLDASLKDPLWAIFGVLIGVTVISCIFIARIQHNEMLAIVKDLQSSRRLSRRPQEQKPCSWARALSVDLAAVYGALAIFLAFLFIAGPSRVVLSICLFFVTLYRTAGWADYIIFGSTYSIVLYSLHTCLSQLIQARRRKLVRIL